MTCMLLPTTHIKSLPIKLYLAKSNGYENLHLCEPPITLKTRETVNGNKKIINIQTSQVFILFFL